MRMIVAIFCIIFAIILAVIAIILITEAIYERKKYGNSSGWKFLVFLSIPLGGAAVILMLAAICLLTTP